MTPTLKKRPGRPAIAESGEAGVRYQIHIPARVAEKLRAWGGGSISRAVIKLARVAGFADKP
jgi:hypothetical protein